MARTAIQQLQNRGGRYGVRPIVITGFPPYGGRSLNPAHEIMRAIDGKTIEGVEVIGRPLPVSIKALAGEVNRIVEEHQPSAVISFGLWPGEAVIRLERVGINLGDFEIPDNDGTILQDTTLSSNGAEARFATLPLRRIEQAMLEAGIPAKVTSTAGTYLCNACLYRFLEATQGRFPRTICGFIHVPYLPEQVAQALTQRRNLNTIATEKCEWPSMDLSTLVRAAEIAVRETLLSEAPRVS
jgi:pyroglutamyl-peptidase